jgi:hypothetical protein
MPDLTIVIKDIPDYLLKDGWRKARHLSKKELGIPIEKVDIIETTFDENYSEYFTVLIADAFVLHSIETANKTLEAKQE